MSVGILGTGSHVPRRVVTNQDLAGIVDTSDDWIVTHTGIRARRYAQPQESTSDLGARAARTALHRAGVGPDSVDALVVATSSPDSPQPATACVMQAKLGLTGIPAFDLNAVCTGFVYALSVAQGLMDSNDRYRHVLVVGSEVYSRLLDFTDRTTCVFFGDGAGAVLLGRVPAGYGLLAHTLYADGTLSDVVAIPAGGSVEPATWRSVQERRHCFRMDGRRVWDFATDALPRVIKESVADAGLDLDDVAMFVPHQANARMLEHCLDRMGVAPSRAALTVAKYGNTAAASVPITLDEAVRAGRIRRGDVVVLAAVGGGMTAGAVVVRWF